MPPHVTSQGPSPQTTSPVLHTPTPTQFTLHAQSSGHWRLVPEHSAGNPLQSMVQTPVSASQLVH
jgi:hypothetical protein